MYKIDELGKQPKILKAGIQYFWKCWGNTSNFAFYEDCINNSLSELKPLPKFYLAIKEEKIIASYALIVNDLISRQDLMPWLACLYVNPEHRNKGIAGELLEHGLKEAASKGFDSLYLSTDLQGFYEKKGWKYLANGYGFSGGEIKIYSKNVEQFPNIR